MERLDVFDDKFMVDSYDEDNDFNTNHKTEYQKLMEKNLYEET